MKNQISDKSNGARIEPRLLKGFRDYGPEEQAARQAMFAKIQSVFERFGFLPLSTPVLEYKDILIGKIGEDEKLIYSFRDNGERDVAMRYDLTVPLARYVAQNQNKLTLPFKRYQIAPVWRAENTQKGRLREFYQCDVDVVGTESPLADAEVMACICKALEELGISNYELKINDRRIFNGFSSILQTDEKQIKEIVREVDKFEKIGKDQVIKNLKEKNVSQLVIDQVNAFLSLGNGEQALEDIGKVASGLVDFIKPYKDQLLELKKNVASQGIALNSIIVDLYIARGLDYYTSTVFEIVLPENPEFGSIVGGGRYDSLVDQFSEKSLPAVGGSIGIDRLFEAMKELGLVKSEGLITALVLNLDENLQSDYVQIVSTLRNAGINSELYYEPAKLDKQFKYAENKGIAFAVILGEQEKQQGIVQVKNLETREQQEIKQTELVSYLNENKPR